MGVNAPLLFQQRWKLFTQNGLTKTCEYREMDTAGYTPGTGIVNQPVLSSTPGLQIIFDKVSVKLVDGSTVRLIDKIALFPVLDLTPVAKVNDIIVDHVGNKWKVKDIGIDPFGAVYDLRVRPIDG